MELTSQWLQVLGLGLILIVATTIFVRAITLAIHGRHSAVRAGYELLLVFTILFFFSHHALNLLQLDRYVAPLDKGVSFLWWISLAFTINALLNQFVWQGILSDNGARRVPKLLTDGAAILVYACALMVVMHYVYDKSITTVLATSGATAFVIGLSAQSTLKEVFAGFSINLTRTVRLGDYVEIDAIYGRVYEINWRNVSILNPHTNSLYIFPNSSVAEKIVLNFSQPTELFKYWVVFHVEYSASPDLVISTITDELALSKYVRRDPKPDFNVLGFSDLGMTYRVRFYFDGDDPWWDAQNEMCMAIWSGLRKKGIRLSIDRHKLLSGDEQEENPWVSNNLLRRDDDLRAKLSRHPVLGLLTEGKREEIVGAGRFLDLTPPDFIEYAKDGNPTVYFVLDGELSILERQGDGSEAVIGVLNNGDGIGLETLVPRADAEGKVSIRCERFSIICQLDAAALKKIVVDSSDVRSALDSAVLAWDAGYSICRERHSEAMKAAARSKQHDAVHFHLREHVEDFFAKPFLHHVLHTILPRSVEKDLLQALMAACALMACSRGDVDEAEIEFFKERLGGLGLFKHVTVDQGLSLFEQEVSVLRTDGENGRHKALNILKAISSEKKLAGIVMGFAYGMASLHEDHLASEENQLLEIAETLNMPAEIDEFVEHIGAQER
jgi:small-conductance mechanosensitive channel/tellurite resistance protein/CRP-like cAMP-binding protein